MSLLKCDYALKRLYGIILTTGKSNYALVSGRKMRLFNILDEFTHEWLSVSVGVSLTSQAVLEALERLFLFWGTPCFVRSDTQ